MTAMGEVAVAVTAVAAMATDAAARVTGVDEFDTAAEDNNDDDDVDEDEEE